MSRAPLGAPGVPALPKPDGGQAGQGHACPKPPGHVSRPPGRPRQFRVLCLRHPPWPWASEQPPTCSAPWPCSSFLPRPTVGTRPLETVRGCRQLPGRGWCPPAAVQAAGPKAPPLCPRSLRPAPPGPGLLRLPVPVLGPGVHAELPHAPALPVQQVGVCLGVPAGSLS